VAKEIVPVTVCDIEKLSAEDKALSKEHHDIHMDQLTSFYKVVKLVPIEGEEGYVPPSTA